MDYNKQILRQIEQSVLNSLKAEENAKKTEESKRTKKLKPPKIFPEGKEADLTKEKPLETSLRRLRSRLSPLARHPVFGSKLNLSDSSLEKWLDAADNNIYLAACKLRKCLEFRRDMGLDDILVNFTPPGVLEAYYPGGLCGVDKQGSPVSYEMIGRMDLIGMMKCVTREQLIMYKLYQFELMKKELERSYPKARNILLIADMTGTTKNTVWGPGLRFFGQIIQLLQDYYPGLVKEVIIIHPSPLYREIYIALRPYLNRKLREKITVLGVNYRKYLLEKVDKHELPGFLGGYKVDMDGNPKCRSVLNWKSKIPVWTYFTNDRMEADVYDVHVLAGCREVMEFHVPCANSRLLWVIYQQNQQMSLAVYKDRLDQPECAVVRPLTISASSTARNYGLKCTYPGRYLMVFDNSKNMAHSLQLKIKISTMYPGTLAGKVGINKPLGDYIDFTNFMSDQEKQTQVSHYLDGPHWDWLDTTPWTGQDPRHVNVSIETRKENFSKKPAYQIPVDFSEPAYKYRY